MMNQEQLKELVEQLEQERNGDKEHDREVLMRWFFKTVFGSTGAIAR
ncbi:MAG: hypothetical protein Q4A32_04650 [Lachnospiraceae bacterium]|nr:hypothetical protein [Lachnospiraceae bacterium]